MTKHNRVTLTADERRRAIAALDADIPFHTVAARFNVCKVVLERETGRKPQGPKGTGLSIRSQKRRVSK